MFNYCLNGLCFVWVKEIGIILGKSRILIAATWNWIGTAFTNSGKPHYFKVIIINTVARMLYKLESFSFVSPKPVRQVIIMQRRRKRLKENAKKRKIKKEMKHFFLWRVKNNFKYFWNLHSRFVRQQSSHIS